MLQHKDINDYAGWILFLFATIIYAITLEPTASFWDCGEYIAVSYKLEVPHPPGAPFFLLLGRMFSFLAMGEVTDVAYWINMMSGLASGLSVMFLFWTIVLIGRKILDVKKGEESPYQKYILLFSGAIGALTLTFADSFWFSAVEAEVYATSSFFTAFVFWAMLKWELIEDHKSANRWLILIAYMMGLSIGIHLLNLVTIPALALIYYFHYYKPTKWGVFASLAISGLIILVIMKGIIPGLPSLAGDFEVFFVNTLGLPFGSGAIFLAALIIGGIIYGIIYSHKNQKEVLNITLVSLVFILIGYGSYALIPIRSSFNPPIDENNPEDLISFVSYLEREQYGSRPLLYGRYFTAEITNQEQGEAHYQRGENQYEIETRDVKNIYDPNHMTLFPRMYSQQQNHPQLYRQWMNLGPNERPTMADNIGFFFRYQFGHMYMRYFMWNFAGRESDIKDAGWLSPFESNADVPEALAENKGRNQFFMLPLILGILGIFLHARSENKSFWVVFMLFLLTGTGLVIYLNSPPVEPRERDYIYVGSYYAFCIWVGFGVMAVAGFIQRFLKNQKVAAYIAFILCLIVPGIMAAEGWNDHDRSNRYFSVDQAKNFLASCAPNAILFTGGDNDTFPLWYAQEVEGFRTDVRVIVLSYFNTEWYINQMTRRAYESEPLNFTLTENEYRQGGPNDYLPYAQNPNIQGAINLDQYIQLIKEGHPALQRTTTSGKISTIPSKNFYVNVDTQKVKQKDIIPDAMDSLITERMMINVQGNGLEKKDLMILDLISTNNWERPIYFNNTSKQGVNLNLDKYLVAEGMTYRLLPVENPNPSRTNMLVNLDSAYENVMNKFYYRELDNPNVYFSEDYRGMVLNHRSSFNSLARALIENGEMEKARKVINKNLETMPDKAIPYDYTAARTVNLLLQTGQQEKAMEIAETIGNRADALLSYYNQKGNAPGNERQKNLIILNELSSTLKGVGNNELAQKFQQAFMEHYQNFNPRQ